MQQDEPTEHFNAGFLHNQSLVDYIPNGRFFLQVGQCARSPETPIVEAARAAQRIACATHEPIWLCMSGGVDSECMALAFIKANVPFRVAIQQFNDGLNEHDIHQAIEFCERMLLPYEVFPLDVVSFYLEDHYLEYALNYRCSSPQLCTHLHLIEQLRGYVVLGGNIVKTHVNRAGRVVLCFPSDLYFCYDRYFKNMSRSGTGLFLMSTPELIYAFFRLPRMQDLIFQRGEMQGRSMDYPTKCQLYRDGGFDVVDRADKFTGFEEVKKYFQKYFGEDERSYDRHFRIPLQELYPPPRENLVHLSQHYLRV
jgi:hypothetical protein